MPRYHSYKGKRGGYWRGRSRMGKYYTRRGCLVILLVPAAAIAVITVAGLAYAAQWHETPKTSHHFVRPRGCLWKSDTLTGFTKAKGKIDRCTGTAQ